ncbi:von Willebrand factor A-like protein [Gracilaria domingensis]|nr:von Willebrand factor A-like protein [Gracilaria domingensis]
MAIDGSEETVVPSLWFEAQKEFVKLLALAIEGDEPKLKYAGVQYGLIPASLSGLKGNVHEFVLDVDSAVYLNASSTFISPGIIECWQHLQEVVGKPQKIVVFLNSRSNYVDFSSAIAAAKSFLAISGNSLFVVGLGSFKIGKIESLAGSPDRAFAVETLTDLVSILPLLVAKICAMVVEAVPVGI